VERLELKLREGGIIAMAGLGGGKWWKWFQRVWVVRFQLMVRSWLHARELLTGQSERWTVWQGARTLQ
jgi:hypothetical protein